LPTYEEYFLMGSVGTQAGEQIRGDAPLSGRSMTQVGPDQYQPTNLRIDYITSNWNFANELTTPGPPMTRVGPGISTSPTGGGKGDKGVGGSPGGSY
jgi:hypothetical protein